MSDAIMDTDGCGGQPMPNGFDPANQPKPLTGPVADAVTDAFWRAAPFAKLVKKLSGCFGGFDGLGKMVLEYEVMTDSGESVCDANFNFERAPLGRAWDDNSPTFKLESIPLPITHSDPGVYKDGDVEKRLTVSQMLSDPSFTDIRVSARKCGELVNRQFLGTVTSETPYDKVYGVNTFPNRQTITYGAFTGTHKEQQQARLKLIQDMITFQWKNHFYGPWLMVHGSSWLRQLDQDFDDEHPTLRAAISNLEPEAAGEDGMTERVILGIHYAQHNWPADAVALVQMTPDVIRVVEGMAPCVLPWGDGLKVAAIVVPQIFTNTHGSCGICVARSEHPPTDPPPEDDDEEPDTPLVV